jgi:transposase-like protein
VDSPELINLAALIDDAKCYEMIRQHRWPDGVVCPGCASRSVIRDGMDDTQKHRQRYRCKSCGGRFDDLSGTILAGHHQPLRVWVLFLYFMGLNLSNRQIAHELGLDEDSVQAMASSLREGLLAKAADVKLEGVVEIDEVYVVAGHKGNPEAVKKKTVRAGAAASRERAAAARWRRKNRPSSG